MKDAELEMDCTRDFSMENNVTPASRLSLSLLDARVTSLSHSPSLSRLLLPLLLPLCRAVLHPLLASLYARTFAA